MIVRRDLLVLRSGYVASVAVAAGAYVVGFGWIASIGALLGGILLARSLVYLYYERFLAFRAYEDFASGRIKHECVACGASCHLRVSLGKNDLEKILKFAKETRIQEPVFDKSGYKYWLRRRSGGACVFLTYSENTPRCQIYSIRPTACRLYPLVPAGSRLKVDPLCPGLSVVKGRTLKQHLLTQEVGEYVRKNIGKI
jgi:Fe-S-cluster containining protein